MSRVLGAAGHHVREAGGAAQALALCREHAPDVLVVDLAMCERDRLAVLDAVKARRGGVPHRRGGRRRGGAGPRRRARAAAPRRAGRPHSSPCATPSCSPACRRRVGSKILQEELVDQTRRIEQQLSEDPLTRLHNRRFLFSQLLRWSAARAAMTGRCPWPWSTSTRFKGVNDRRGHAVGDAMLVAVGRALRGGLRKEDAVGRLGGEEFLALLPDTAGSRRPCARPSGCARRWPRRTARSPSRRASAGPRWSDGEDADDLVRRADDALYAAKAEGRNCVRGAVGGPASLPRRT